VFFLSVKTTLLLYSACTNFSSIHYTRHDTSHACDRNPWGSMEWTGDWSDTSPLWTEEMQAEIEVIEASDDGMFWMSFEDLVKNFYSVNVCMVRHKVSYTI
jgi:hypothetical protein